MLFNETTEMQEQETAVSPAGAVENEPTKEPGAAGTPAADAKPADTPAGSESGEEHDDWKTQENAENAQRRRMAEAARQQRMFREMTAGLNDPETGKPFESIEAWQRFRQRTVLAAKAQEAGVEPAAAQKLMDGMRETIKETDPEYRQAMAQAEAARQQQYEAVFAQDLAAIKQLYPDEKAKDIRDLGDEFMAMMASGQVDAVSAYEAIRARKNRTSPKPPSTGGLGSDGGKKPAYFTKEQVDAMSDAEIDKNYDAIRKSMMRW